MRITSRPAIRPASRVACARIVEVGRDSDDGAVDFVVHFALLGEERLGAALQLPQDERRDLGRRELAFAQADSDHASALAADAERQQARLALDVVEALAHEALDGVNRVRRVRQQAPLRFPADIDGPIRPGRHDRGQQRVAATVANDDGHAVLHVRDQAVGRPEIDANDTAHCVSSLSMPASRLLM